MNPSRVYVADLRVPDWLPLPWYHLPRHSKRRGNSVKEKNGDPRELLRVETSAVVLAGKEGDSTGTSASEATPGYLSPERAPAKERQSDTLQSITRQSGSNFHGRTKGRSTTRGGNVVLTELERKPRLLYVLVSPSITLGAGSPRGTRAYGKPTCRCLQRSATCVRGMSYCLVADLGTPNIASITNARYCEPAKPNFRRYP